MAALSATVHIKVKVTIGGMEAENPPDDSPKYRLLSNNHPEPIPISQAAIRQSKTWETLVKRWGPHDPKTTVPIQVNTDFKTLQRIVKWCEHHKNDEEPTEEEKDANDIQLPYWDEKHLDIPPGELYDFIWAITPLEIERLLIYSCKMVANMAKGKTPDEMAVIFGIEKDPETEEETAQEKVEEAEKEQKEDEEMEDEDEEGEEGESSI